MTNNKKINKDLIIFKAKSGEIELKEDLKNETIWITQRQIAEIFDVNVRTVNEHLNNIFKTRELNKDLVIRKFRITASDGKKYNTYHYNLDAVISVGYRVNSKRATRFRIWATKILKQHLTEGYTINKKLVATNYTSFVKALSDVKLLLPNNNTLSNTGVLDLVNAFAYTWFSLDAYDKGKLPQDGFSKKQVDFTTTELTNAISNLKTSLIRKKEATNIFAQENKEGSLESIVASVFQSFDNEDVYKTPEEKAVHLLYFIVKNHPFIDGNKRSGAFAFIWFLQKIGALKASLSPQALTAITLLIAESDPKDKERVIGLLLLLLRN